jgi:hypothetical protein
MFLCRIFQVGTRVFADGQVGGFEETGMSYPDFIFFMLSEEDKSSQVALRYWYVKTTDCLHDLLRDSRRVCSACNLLYPAPLCTESLT